MERTVQLEESLPSLVSKGKREAFGYDQNYSPLAGQARLCFALAWLLYKGKVALRRDALPSWTALLTSGSFKGAVTLELHPGSSLLKNLKKQRGAINTLDKFKHKSSESLVFCRERGTNVRVACWLLCYHNK